MNHKLSKGAALVTLLATLTVSQPAFAYLDPGTGSMIISAIVGLFATVGLALKTYWYKLKSFFTGSSTPASEEPEAEQAESRQDA